METGRRCLAIVLVLVTTAGARAGFPECGARVRAAPQDLDAWQCYITTARQDKAWADATRILETRLAREPDNPFVLLMLASVEGDGGRGPESAEAHLRSAADRFAAAGNAHGEVWARLGLAVYLARRRESLAAESEVRRAEEVAGRSGERPLMTQVRIQRAREAYGRGDYNRSWILFRELRDDFFEGARVEQQGAILNGLGNSCWGLGRPRDAMGYYRQEAAHWEKSGNRYDESIARYNIALIARSLWSDGDIATSEWAAALDEALRATVAAGNLTSEASVRLQLAEGPYATSAQRRAHIQRALEISRRMGLTGNTCFALRLLAIEEGQTDHGAALGHLEEAVALARSRGDVHQTALGHLVRGSVQLTQGDSEGVAEMFRGLDTAEKIRALQMDDTARAGSFARWTGFYYRLCGYLLDPPKGTRERDGLDQAFGVSERLRAGMMLDALDAARIAIVPDAGDAGVTERAAVLAGIARSQRSLLDPKLTDEARAQALAAIDRLEIREAALRYEIGGRSPAFGRARAPAIPHIADVQRGLQPDEALLSFLLSERKGADTDGVRQYDWGGSWVFVITRNDARAFPLRGRKEVETAVSLYLGLVERRDGSESAAAATVYSMLLGDAVDGLPSTAHRLLIVPDGCLHRLPFESLRSAPGAPPLAMRWEIDYVPSAAFLLGWRTREPESAPTAVLALADPSLPSAEATVVADTERAGSLARGLRLGPLPSARTEAAALAHALGPGSRILTGGEASEKSLKTSDLRAFGMLHFAAHAVVDDVHPEHSAVLLAPGDASEDGLLQMREVVPLPLQGRVVVLSACRSASGQMIAGEGPLGIARAFFQAGARTVVGSLWPLRDDDAAAFVEAMAGGLARGLSVGESAAEARRERIAAGVPARDWAGLIVLGDPETIPLPGGAPSGGGAFHGGLLIALLLIACGAAIGLLRWRATP